MSLVAHMILATILQKRSALIALQQIILYQMLKPITLADYHFYECLGPNHVIMYA